MVGVMGKPKQTRLDACGAHIDTGGHGDVDIWIDSEFESFMPQMDTSSFQLLKSDIELRGEVLEPIMLWINNSGRLIVVDGHNRLRAVQQVMEGGGRVLGVASRFVPVHVETREDVLDWMSDKQLGRRNLTKEERAYYLGRAYRAKKKSAKEAIATASEANPNNNPDAESNRGGKMSPQSHATAREIAQKHGVNEKTVRRAEKTLERKEAVAEHFGLEASALPTMTTKELKAYEEQMKAETHEPDPLGDIRKAIEKTERELKRARDYAARIPQLENTLEILEHQLAEMESQDV